jgi:phospholipid/cholesterol/gamma-HCH transport system substrate-binding protein
METRARYALIGLFMLAVIIGSFAFVYWLENKGGFGQRDTYRVEFQSDVSGLAVGSSVLFNGLRVGEVTGLSLDPSAPNEVIATIAVDHGTPIRADTKVGMESQGLAGGMALTLRGGTGTAPLTTSQSGTPPLLMAEPNAGQGWTDAARDAFEAVQSVIDQNSKSLHSAIDNIDTFAGALARNAAKVDGILAGLEKMTGGGTGQKPPLYDLSAVHDFPPAPETPPAWQLVVPEPSALLGINTDKILSQPATGEVAELPDAKWADNLPVLFQAKIVQSFENAGYAQSVSRPRDGVANAYQLLLDIRRFAISTGSQPAEADVAFVAKIVDPNGKILGAKTFSTKAAADGSDIKAYVGAFNKAFATLMPELFDWTTMTLKDVPPPEAPSDEAAPSEPSEPAPPDSGDAEPEMPPMPDAPAEPAPE